MNISLNAFADPSFPDRGASLVANQTVGNAVLRAYAKGIADRANIDAQMIGNTSDYSALATRSSK